MNDRRRMARIRRIYLITGFVWAFISNLSLPVMIIISLNSNPKKVEGYMNIILVLIILGIISFLVNKKAFREYLK